MARAKNPDKATQTNIVLVDADKLYLSLWQGGYKEIPLEQCSSAILSAGCREAIAYLRKMRPRGPLSRPVAKEVRPRNREGTKTYYKARIRTLEKELEALRSRLSTEK